LADLEEKAKVDAAAKLIAEAKVAKQAKLLVEQEKLNLEKAEKLK
jgi:hypothetical protein